MRHTENPINTFLRRAPLKTRSGTDFRTALQARLVQYRYNTVCVAVFDILDFDERLQQRMQEKDKSKTVQNEKKAGKKGQNSCPPVLLNRHGGGGGGESAPLTVCVCVCVCVRGVCVT